MVFWLFLILKVIGVLAIMLINVIFFNYLLRKVLADLQIRMGPMRVGYHGILQPIADALKLLLKEDTVPQGADRLLFNAAPFFMMIPAFLLYLTVPIAKGWIARDLDVGIFYIFAIITIIPVGVIIAGWGSYNKWSLFGGLRGAAQQISYEVPMLLSFLGVVMLVGSFSLTKIAEAQKGMWFILLQPFGFLLYFIAMLAEVNRLPFDIPEAESELVQGYSTEYSGMKFAFLFMAEFSNLILLSAVAVLLFFGGWQGPILPPVVWFFIKTYLLIYTVIWLWGTLPRIRIDQLLSLGWKVLLPAALINILLTGVLMLT